MSVLAMILTAAMVVPGDGSEETRSGEIVQSRLDVSGGWQGHCNVSFRIRECRMTFKGWEVIDEGNGRAQFKIPVLGGGRLTRYGIYEQDGDRLRICIAPHDEPRPTRFDGGNGRLLFVLRRIKSSK